MENIEKIIKISKTRKEALQYLGWNINGTNYKKLKQLIEKNNLSVAHFLTSSDIIKENNKRKDKIPIKDLTTENCIHLNRKNLKRRLVNEGLMEYKCVFCGNKGEWMGHKMTLVLDHINGVNNDNRIENLRLVCPNCDAILPTYCGKNKKNEKNKKTPKKLPRKSALGIQMPRRKAERPPLDILLEEIKNLGYSATGRKYNVSDNAIRKWVKIYNKYNSIQPSDYQI